VLVGELYDGVFALDRYLRMMLAIGYDISLFVYPVGHLDPL
jgi:hypothetical protein